MTEAKNCSMKQPKFVLLVLSFTLIVAKKFNEGSNRMISPDKNSNRLTFDLWMHNHSNHAVISGYLLMQGNAAVFVACFAKA